MHKQFKRSRAKSSSGRANAQAHELLRTLCNFVIPLVQSTNQQIAKNVKKFPSGPAADEFITALQKFIWSSQGGRKDFTLNARLRRDPFEYLEGTYWIWDLPVEKDSEEFYNPPQMAIEVHGEPKVYSQRRAKLRRHIDTTMPIRLLYFKQHDSDSEFKISLIDRAEVYDLVTADLLDMSVPSRVEYAILSHTWNHSPGEITFADWRKGLLNARHPKCQKLVNFCKAAWQNHRLAFGWIDTVCIDKDNSAELDESIRSMYAWYSNSSICITYLAGTETLLDMENDPWFHRGWTFQELIAPPRMKFYNLYWDRLIEYNAGVRGDKHHPQILRFIENATTMTPKEVLNIWQAPISRRMQLAARRKVTREEDAAYSLMGIFNVSISTEYGEGPERASFRLVREIFNSTKDVLDIFNWGGDNAASGRTQTLTSLFPSRLSYYLTRSSAVPSRPWRPIEPLTLTHLGLRTPILFMSAVPSSEAVSGPIGDYYTSISIDVEAEPANGPSGFEIPQSHLLLRQRVPEPEDESRGILRIRTVTWAFAVLNFEVHDETSIQIPKTCFAVLVERQGKGVEPAALVRNNKIYTKKPIVFNLEKKASNSEDDDNQEYYEVEKTQLANHGMELDILYM